MRATWLADVLRDAGLKVVEQPGWKTRGLGDFSDIVGVICHHTAGSRKGNAPSLNLVQNGRPGLRGPLSQLVLGRDGTWFVVASGRSNHAGRGRWNGETSGNSKFIGVEAENTGLDNDQPWPEEQMESYIKGVAAILSHIKADDIMAVGHKEWALPRGRKIDPTFDMVEFREGVRAAMANKPIKTQPVAVNPTWSMLKRGDRGSSVKELQELLGVTPDGDFGPITERAVKRFQDDNNLIVDGLVGPKTWAALNSR